MATVQSAAPQVSRGVEPLRAGQGTSFILHKLHSLLGIVPIGAFLLEHLLSNFEALKGPIAYGQQVKFLNSLPLVRVLEWVFIFLPILYHGVYGVYIWLRGKSNVVYYPWAGNWMYLMQRYTGLVGSDAVSQQDTDNFVNQASATAATVKSAQANVQRLKEMQSFEKVIAPFDGVVTARNVDTGQLINQGAGTELFHMQTLQTLRVYANIPQVYSQSVKRGMKIPLTFPEYPGKTFTGTLVRTSDAIDPTSRTLLVEVDLDNRSGELMPGSLAQVHFKTPPIGPTFIVPSAALIFRREGLRVGTVVDGEQAHLAPVVIGQDDGATVQIIHGLQPGDRVIQDPPDSLIEGEKVSVVQPDAGGQ